MTARGAPPDRLGRRVAVVDDDPRTLRTMQLLLREEGYSVEVFSDATTALEALRAERFDALVTDHVLPGLQGLALARIVRREMPHVRCVIVSGHDPPKSFADEEIPWLIKPVSFDALVAAIG